RDDPDHVTDNAASCREEVGLGESGRPVAVRHVFAGVANRGVVDPEAPQEVTCVRPYVLHVEPEEQDSPCTPMLPSPLQPRCFFAAWRAPRSPEVQDHRRASELPKTQFGTGESRGESLQPAGQYSALQNLSENEVAGADWLAASL